MLRAQGNMAFKRKGSTEEMEGGALRASYIRSQASSRSEIFQNVPEYKAESHIRPDPYQRDASYQDLIL